MLREKVRDLIVNGIARQKLSYDITDSILSCIAEEVPKDKDPANFGGDFLNGKVNGWNQALAEIREILKGGVR